MGAQEVTRGVQIYGSAAPQQSEPVHPAALNHVGALPETPEFKQRIFSLWRKDKGSELFMQELEQVRQKLLTSAQNSVMSGIRTYEDVSHQLIMAGMLQKIHGFVENGTPIV